MRLDNAGLRYVLLVVIIACGMAGARRAKGAEDGLACEPFTVQADIPETPRHDRHWLQRSAQINEAVKTGADRVLFLGDSITERWPAAIWNENFARRGGVNAGIDGDRTEHLLWRLDHGNLDGKTPRVVVLLIGTNDLGHGRPPELAAEGIRANLLYLRQRLPTSQILLLGLTPRSDRFGRDIAAVNRLVRTCEGDAVTYADIGHELLDPQGRLPRTMSTDGVHFTAAGYEKLAPQLDALIDRLLSR